MCILFMYHGNSTCRYKLIVASNRDEYFERPTLPACFHHNDQILCGQDLQQGDGGTWLGINRNGKFATLTNYPVEKEEKSKKSRGSIVKNYLVDDCKPQDYINKLQSVDYRPYNVITAEINEKVEAFYYSNRDGKAIPTRLTPGINILASTSINNKWNKVQHGNTIFKNIIKDISSYNEESLTKILLENLLSDKTSLYPDSLVQEQSKTRMPKEFLMKYCSIQITDNPIYGTGVQTVLLVDQENNVTYSERTLDLSLVKSSNIYNNWNELNRFKFKIN